MNNSNNENIPFNSAFGGLPSWAKRSAFDTHANCTDNDERPFFTEDQDAAKLDNIKSMSIRPLFYLSSLACNIVQMKYNNHKNLLAIVTSQNEVLITETSALGSASSPAVVAQDVCVPYSEENALQQWSVNGSTVLVDKLPGFPSDLLWVSWQHGFYLCTFIRECQQLNLYCYSKNKWMLSSEIQTGETISVSISPQFTIALGGRLGQVRLLARDANSSSEIEQWVLVDSFQENSSSVVDVLSEEKYGKNVEDSSTEPRINLLPDLYDSTCLDWEKSGLFLAVGDKGGRLRVFLVIGGGTRFSSLVYSGVSDLRVPCIISLSWAPLAGRSFLTLTVLYEHQLTVFVFRRSKHLLQAISGAAKHGSSRAPTLDLLSSFSTYCEGAFEIQWNSTGTQFLTTHRDGSVNVWGFEVRYQQQTAVPHIREAQPVSSSTEMQTGKSGDRSRKKKKEFSQDAEPKLSLKIHAKIVSHVKPANS